MFEDWNIRDLLTSKQNCQKLKYWIKSRNIEASCHPPKNWTVKTTDFSAFCLPFYDVINIKIKRDKTKERKKIAEKSIQKKD